MQIGKPTAVKSSTWLLKGANMVNPCPIRIGNETFVVLAPSPSFEDN